MANTSTNPLQERFKASMLLSAAGDAMGYKNGDWEFNFNGEEIVRQVEAIGFDKLNIKKPEFILSDDTIMSIATATALVEASHKTKEELFISLAHHYKECMNDMKNRAPGNQCLSSTKKLNLLKPDGYQIPFCERGGGCGAAMRSASIGLLYYKPEDSTLKKLVDVSVESGRMTHNHPTGFLGSLATALFTSYAIQERKIEEWGFALLDEAIPIAKEFCKKRPCVPDDFHGNEYDLWEDFIDRWKKYLNKRFPDGKNAVFPPPAEFGVKERDKFYKDLSYSGWGGSSGHDCPMIAYDALLGCNKSWKELCYRAMFHGGDNDSTGTVSGAWFGALYGIPDDVPSTHYANLEYKKKIEKLAEDLYKLATQTTSHQQ